MVGVLASAGLRHHAQRNTHKWALRGQVKNGDYYVINLINNLPMSNPASSGSINNR